jgi:cation transport ATPase
MRVGRLGAGELVAGAGGLLLLVILFFDWFDGQSGWSSLGWLMVLLLAAVIALAGWVVAATASGASVAQEMAAGVLLTTAAAVTFLVLLVRVLTHAGTPTVCAWLGLAFTALIAVGGWLDLDDERTGRAATST